MAAIFFNKSIQNLHFLGIKMFECFISNLKLVLANIFFFQNMKNNKVHKIGILVIIKSSMGVLLLLLVYNPAHYFL